MRKNKLKQVETRQAEQTADYKAKKYAQMVRPLQAGLINPFAISYLGSGKLTNTRKKIFITTFIQTETFLSPFSSGFRLKIKWRTPSSIGKSKNPK